jgi:hypothetical protein
MSALTSAKLYGRVALLRRQVLVRHLIHRVIAGALAVAAFIVAAGLATYALFLTIRVPLGDLGACLAVAALYLGVGVILLIITLRETSSPEQEALAELESVTLEAMMSDPQGAVQMMNAAGHRLETLGDSLSLGMGLLSALRKLRSARKA